MRTSSNKVKPTIQFTIEKILACGRMSRREHLDLTSALLSDQQISERDRLQINRVLEDVQIGRLDLVD